MSLNVGLFLLRVTQTFRINPTLIENDLLLMRMIKNGFISEVMKEVNDPPL